MTVDELIKSLRDGKNNGILIGDEEVVFMHDDDYRSVDMAGPSNADGDDVPNPDGMFTVFVVAHY